MEKPYDSWLWKKLISLRSYITPLLSFTIGDGRKTELWRDLWIAGGKFLLDYILENMYLNLGKKKSCFVSEIVMGISFRK